MDTITIDIYKKGDEKEINTLYNEIFNEKRGLKEWKWKFCNSPIDSRTFIILARDRDKTVGQYACIATFMKYFDKELKVLQPVDNMIHKDYRGGAKGLQVQMLERMEEIVYQEMIPLGLGFPNRQAYIVGKRFLKYKDLFNVEHLLKRLSWRITIKRRLNIAPLVKLIDIVSRSLIRLSISISMRRLKGVEFKWTSILDKRVDSLWNAIKGQYDIMIKRDFVYLNWRYCQHPGKKYDILLVERDNDIIGLLIVKYEMHEDIKAGLIMECLSLKEPSLMGEIIKRGILYLSGKGADYVVVRVTPGDPVKEVFCKTGFSKKEVIWDSYFVYKRYSDVVDESILKDPSNWHISFGDCEAV
jgi:hypothetical protein